MHELHRVQFPGNEDGALLSHVVTALPHAPYPGFTIISPMAKASDLLDKSFVHIDIATD